MSHDPNFPGDQDWANVILNSQVDTSTTNDDHSNTQFDSTNAVNSSNSIIGRNIQSNVRQNNGNNNGYGTGTMASASGSGSGGSGYALDFSTRLSDDTQRSGYDSTHSTHGTHSHSSDLASYGGLGMGGSSGPRERRLFLGSSGIGKSSISGISGINGMSDMDKHNASAFYDDMLDTNKKYTQLQSDVAGLIDKYGNRVRGRSQSIGGLGLPLPPGAPKSDAMELTAEMQKLLFPHYGGGGGVSTVPASGGFGTKSRKESFDGFGNCKAFERRSSFNGFNMYHRYRQECDGFKIVLCSRCFGSGKVLSPWQTEINCPDCSGSGDKIVSCGCNICKRK